MAAAASSCAILRLVAHHHQQQQQQQRRRSQLRYRDQFSLLSVGSTGSPRFFFRFQHLRSPPPQRTLSIWAVASEPKQKAFQENGIPATKTSDADSIASKISHHAKFLTGLSPSQVESQTATAQSVRDTLVERWNKTYDLFQTKNPKQAYYLSMEFLQNIINNSSCLRQQLPSSHLSI